MYWCLSVDLFCCKNDYYYRSAAEEKGKQNVDIYEPKQNFFCSRHSLSESCYPHILNGQET